MMNYEAAAVGGERLILLAKAPILSLVKTRLAATLGPGKALEVHCDLLSVLSRNLAPLETVTLCVTPDESGKAFDPWRQQHWPVWPQGAGDLGARLARAFVRAFQEGAKRVVILGADCPEASADHVREAWRGLREADLVLGPAKDGGYWLIGLSRFVPELFEEMPWSAATLCDRTLVAAKNQNLRVALLETLADIDTAEDWLAYLAGRRGVIWTGTGRTRI
jgi:rSAM/selenodomain-associated transferase 1